MVMQHVGSRAAVRGRRRTMMLVNAGRSSRSPAVGIGTPETRTRAAPLNSLAYAALSNEKQSAAMRIMVMTVDLHKRMRVAVVSSRGCLGIHC